MSDVNFEAGVRYRRGADLHDLMDELIDAGFPAEVVEEAVMRVHRRVVGDDRRRGLRNFILGLVVFVAGGGVTVWTAANGMAFVGVWVATVLGAGWLVLGALQIARAGKDRSLVRLSALGG